MTAANICKAGSRAVAILTSQIRHSQGPMEGSITLTKLKCPNEGVPVFATHRLARRVISDRIMSTALVVGRGYINFIVLAGVFLWVEGARYYHASSAHGNIRFLGAFGLGISV